MEKKLLTSKDASSLIGCSQSTLRNYEEKGLLVPVVKSGTRRYYSKGQVNQFIIEYCAGSDNEMVDEQEQVFLSRSDVHRRLSLSYEALEELDRQGLLCPCRRFPLNNKRLYRESDIDKFISVICNR